MSVSIGAAELAAKKTVNGMLTSPAFTIPFRFGSN
jgi:hypothetical protein